MTNDVGSMSKSLTTSTTFERFLSSVRECMKLQSFISSEHLTTHFAAEFLYVAVGAAVAAEVGAVREPPPTDITRIWLRLAVGCHVRLQLTLPGEDLTTVAAMMLSRVGLVAMLPEPFLGGENLPTLLALMVIGMYKLDMLLQHSFVLKWREAELTSSVPVRVSDVHGHFAQRAELNSTLTARVTCCHLREHVLPALGTLLAVRKLPQHGVCRVEWVRHERF